MARIAVVSDPHLTCEKTFRRGRLLGLSFQLFADVLQTISAEDFDALVIPGDLADGGNETAYAYAKEQLRRLNTAKLILPGNQDILETMCKYFPGAGNPKVVLCRGCILVGLDTSQGSIDRNAVAWLEDQLQKKREKPMLIFTHYALGSAFGGQLAAGSESVLSLLAGSPQVWGVFSGHKNAIHTVRIGRTIHVTCPQIVHYPCAWNIVEVYEEGLMFWIRQIDDLRLISLSREEGDRWFGHGWSANRMGDPESRAFAHLPC